MAGTKVPRDPNISQEMRRFLDDLARLTDTLNASGFAPLASPAFTGTPTSPTPSPGDSDTSIATTAFVAAALAASPQVVKQCLQTTYATNADITAQIPGDDTPPLIGEGTEILSQAITLADNTNKVLVEVGIHGSTSTNNGDIVVAVFRGSTCIQAIRSRCTTADFPMAISAPAILDAPASASAQTYSVRVGPVGAITIRMNGSTGGRNFGGASHCTLTLTEIEAS